MGARGRGAAAEACRAPPHTAACAQPSSCSTLSLLSYSALTSFSRSFPSLSLGTILFNFHSRRVEQEIEYEYRVELHTRCQREQIREAQAAYYAKPVRPLAAEALSRAEECRRVSKLRHESQTPLSLTFRFVHAGDASGGDEKVGLRRIFEDLRGWGLLHDVIEALGRGCRVLLRCLGPSRGLPSTKL